MKHPAKYSDALLPVFARMLHNRQYILDPFGGTGKIFELKKWLPDAKIFAVEIEPEWANCIVADALNLPFKIWTFDAISVSCCYGNRMADHHIAKDNSKRNTYTHTLGRTLHPHNSGSLQWGEEYRQFHRIAWVEAKSVLKPDGLFILNIKDHIRKGQRQYVTAWHIEFLQEIGFTMLEHVKVPCPGNRQGANSTLRIDYESVILFQNN
jgi:SAM-dependent methyltransferase